jgi:hypothetical protein
MEYRGSRMKEMGIGLLEWVIIVCTIGMWVCLGVMWYKSHCGV